MARILITTDYLVPGDDIDRLLHQHGHETFFAPFTEPRNSVQQECLLSGYDGAIIASEPITEKMLAAAPTLKVLARSGVGYDSIDTSSATKYGVKVCNAPETNHHSVAEMTFGLILAFARRLTHVTTGVQQGNWPREAGHELRGATLGIIGYGPSGRATAQIGLAFGMTVLVSTAYPDSNNGDIQFTDLDTVVSNADYLSLHTRSGQNASQIIDESQLRAMKPTSVLINTARGSLVDEAALAQALSKGSIAGAALDVLAKEPLADNSPLRGLNNVLITSHLAGQTIEARRRAGLVAAQAVIDVLADREPAHSVNH